MVGVFILQTVLTGNAVRISAIRELAVLEYGSKREVEERLDMKLFTFYNLVKAVCVSMIELMYILIGIVKAKVHICIHCSNFESSHRKVLQVYFRSDVVFQRG